MSLTLREAIDRTAGNENTEGLITAEDHHLLSDYADTVASHAGISRGTPAHRTLTAALALMYRAGVVAGQSDK